MFISLVKSQLGDLLYLFEHQAGTYCPYVHLLGADRRFTLR